MLSCSQVRSERASAVLLFMAPVIHMTPGGMHAVPGQKRAPRARAGRELTRHVMGGPEVRGARDYQRRRPRGLGAFAARFVPAAGRFFAAAFFAAAFFAGAFFAGAFF